MGNEGSTFGIMSLSMCERRTGPRAFARVLMPFRVTHALLSACCEQVVLVASAMANAAQVKQSCCCLRCNRARVPQSSLSSRCWRVCLRACRTRSGILGITLLSPAQRRACSALRARAISTVVRRLTLTCTSCQWLPLIHPRNTLCSLPARAPVRRRWVCLRRTLIPTSNSHHRLITIPTVCLLLLCPTAVVAAAAHRLPPAVVWPAVLTA